MCQMYINTLRKEIFLFKRPIRSFQIFLLSKVMHILNKQYELALLSWELCSSDLAKSSNENVSICCATKTGHHHTAAFKERFIKDVKKVDDSFSANLFEGDSLSQINCTLISFDK